MADENTRNPTRHECPRPRSRDTRLRLSGDFANVLGQRHRKSDPYLVVYAADNSLGYTRLGLSVGRRVGPAVTRNRVRRVIREAFRRGQVDWPAGLDVVCIVKPLATSATRRLPESFRKLLAAVAAEMSATRKTKHRSTPALRRGHR